jgi:hypothetical protein
MTLIQPNVKYYIDDILSKCHEKKTTLYYWIFNITIVFIFLSTTFCILYYRYKNKPSEQELREKMIRDQKYILEQIRFYQGQMKTSSQITNLPTIDEIRQGSDTVERNGVYDPKII